MTATEDRIRALRAEIGKRQQERARAEVALASAQELEQAALKALAEEFGVPGLDEAAVLLVGCETDLEQACAAAEAALTEAEK